MPASMRLIYWIPAFAGMTTGVRPRTIHHQGYGSFVVDGPVIKLKSRMR
jgi:hypothetical protein